MSAHLCKILQAGLQISGEFLTSALFVQGRKIKIKKGK